MDRNGPHKNSSTSYLSTYLPNIVNLHVTKVKILTEPKDPFPQQFGFVSQSLVLSL